VYIQDHLRQVKINQRNLVEAANEKRRMSSSSDGSVDDVRENIYKTKFSIVYYLLHRYLRYELYSNAIKCIARILHNKIR